LVNVHTERRFEISRKADQFIQGLPVKLRQRTKEAIDCLIKGDMHHLDIKPLSPYPHEYRLRVGKVRILFRADKELLFIFKAGFRGDIYK
jgi:mRNA interferase RelE/StbE